MNRRDFLKLAALVTISNLPIFKPNLFSPQNNHNIIMIVLDSLSAKNMSLYGYQRQTTPFLEKFAQNATVFHRHYTPGTFTPPGTASILTGTNPSTHRVTRIMGRIPRPLETHNIFDVLSPVLNNAGYTQNFQVEMLLQQFKNAIDIYTSVQETAEIYQQLFGFPFKQDLPAAYWGERISRGENETFRGSIYLSGLVDIIQEIFIRKTEQKHNKTYLNGLPHNYQGMAYLPANVFSWLKNHVQQLPSPFFSYYHLYPPHQPYQASTKFKGIFPEKWKPTSKPISSYGEDTDYSEACLEYDEFIAETDFLLGKTLEFWHQSGLLDNSYVIITSDHGEMFERGIWGHLTPTLYEPLINVPLIIQEPGQTTRRDIHTPTSSIDILPTLCKINDLPIPDWAEGEFLPIFSQSAPDPDRPIYSMDFKSNKPQGKYTSGTLGLIKNNFKLIHYFGYKNLENSFEFYDLEADPEELKDLYPSKTNQIKQMEAELLEKLSQINIKANPIET